MPLDANALSLGAGFLYIAAVSSPEPSDLTTAWDGSWVKIGYTKEGHTFTYGITNEGIMVAEVLGPVRSENTERTLTVEFEMAEITATNLVRAMNGGDSVTGAGIVTVQPPSLRDAVIYKALGWEAFDASERIVWRKCIQSGEFAVPRKKAPDYATIPVTFSVLEVDEATKPFKHIFDDSRA